MNKTTQLSILVPTHNEEKNIEATIKALQKYQQKTSLSTEVIIVCDGCTDNTEPIAKTYENDTLKVHSYKKNKGKGGAIREGFKITKGEAIAFFDAGLDFPPQDLERFYKHLQKYNTDGIIGSKRHKDSTIQYPLMRKIVSKGGQIVVKTLFWLPYADTQVGMKMFKRNVLVTVLPEIKIKQYAFDIELLVLATMKKFKIKEAPVTLNFNSEGGTGVNTRAILLAFTDTLRIFKYKLQKRYFKK